MRRHPRLTWLCALVASVVWPALANHVPPLLESQTGSELVHLRPAVEDLVQAALPLSVVLMALLAAGLALRSGPRFGIAAAAVTLACCLAAFFPAALLAPPAWATVHSAHAPDGHTYRLLRRNIFWSDILALERVQREGAVFTTGLLLGSEYVGLRDDGPSVLIVRPEGLRPRGYRHLYLSADGLLLAGWENCVHFAYDTASSAFLDRARITDLSPFALVGPDAALNEDDARQFADAVARRRRADYRSSPYPSDDVLSAALNHPNARVRAFASRLLSG